METISATELDWTWYQSGAADHSWKYEGAQVTLFLNGLTDGFRIQHSTARTNPTFFFENQTLAIKTQTDQTDIVQLNLVQNHDTPADFRTLANIDFFAENSSSVDTVYGRISVSSQDVTATTEDGLLQLGVVSDGTLVSGMDIEGGTSASTGAALGFYGHSTTTLQTGVAVTSAGIHAALVNLGLITA